MSVFTEKVEKYPQKRLAPNVTDVQQTRSRHATDMQQTCHGHEQLQNRHDAKTPQKTSHPKNNDLHGQLNLRASIFSFKLTVCFPYRFSHRSNHRSKASQGHVL
jgi:hypothetical protein